MDQSRRAVNSYWRSRMVDAVTSDEDKVAPVYKLEEICDLLRTAHVSIVKEMSEFVLKRLDHKSPIVKQKALRLIKYTVGKSGTEFRREMQRHSAVVKQLFHYKGHPDPLKGDALNKAVRDTAHEAVSAIFANEDNNSNNSSSNNKAVAPTEGFQKRIQGFGNTNYEMPSEEKKSFLSEVVGIGLSTIAAANSMRKGESGISGSYKSPNLRRSLNTDIGGGGERYEGGEYHSESSYASSGSSRNVASGTWGQELRTTMNNTAADEDTTLSHLGVKSREERLLETIVTSGGVRLQPTRDAIHVFLTEASKLDAVAMSRALEMKLQSHLWQVRMKACCVLEAILRKKDDEHFSIIASYFSENVDSLVKCSELPQVSLREKATKVLSLLEGDQSSRMGEAGESSPMPVPAVEMPDLIDTGEPDDYGSESSMQKHVDPNSGNLVSSGSIVDELFGDAPRAAGLNTNENINDDPFADVSFHVNEDKQDDNIFSGLAVDSSRFEHEQKRPSSNGSGMIDMFSSISDHPVQGIEGYTGSMNDLMAGLSLNGTVQDNKQPGTSFVNGISQSSQLPTNGGPNGGLGSSTLFPLAPMQYNMPANMIFNPAFPTQPMNYGAMGALIAEHQLLLQNLGNMNSGGYGHNTGNVMDGGYSSPLPDIFHLSNNHAQYHTAVLTTAKKEDTKAFDFISDHLSAARDSKRVL